MRGRSRSSRLTYSLYWSFRTGSYTSSRQSRRLCRDGAVMSEAERSRRQRELADQDRELQRKQREFTEDLNQRTFEERAKIAEKANLVLKQIAEQRKLDIIVQEAAYVNPKADVTDDVIKALNSQK